MRRLTEKELNLFKVFVQDYKTPQNVLDDNFTCKTVEELREVTGLSNKEIGGTLASLETKGIIYLEERDGATCKVKNKFSNFEPDLYWVDEDFLETLDPNLDFKAL